MGDRSKIEWTDATWNPTVGCSLVSPGCTNCYAMKVAARMEAISIAHERDHGGDPGPLEHYRGTTQHTRGGPVWTGTVRPAFGVLEKPLRWKRPRRIFVNSMSDLFHDSVEDEWIDKVFAVMAMSTQHTFQLLTKRPERMRDYLRSKAPKGDASIARQINSFHHSLGDRRGILELPLFNVWLGVSIENQAAANERVECLVQTPAAVRFVSAEPLLGPIDLTNLQIPRAWGSGLLDAFTLDWKDHHQRILAGPPKGYGPVQWVIVGGESGPGARPMHPDWARSLRDQCAANRVPFFFKQWGEWAPDDLPSELQEHYELLGQWNGTSRKMGKRTAGRELDGRTHQDWPRV